MGRALINQQRQNIRLKRYDKAIDLFLLLIENANSKRELDQANEGLMMAYYANDDAEKNALPIATEMSTNVSLSESKRNLVLYLLRISMDSFEYDKALLLATALINSTNDEIGAEAAFNRSDTFQSK